jgi:PTH1 family peptidyl-tRNA hydrolase
MKVIVGLGNPGKKYQGTRHNIGFEVLTTLAGRLQVDRVQQRFKAETATTLIGGTRVLLVSPLTYMNLSGQSVKRVVDFFKLDLTDLILICDDMSLDLGRLRLRTGGSAGGQKGLADTIEKLGTDQFPRLRIGIGRPPNSIDPATFVLQSFASREKPEMEIACQRAADALETWVKEGIAAAMNRFNPAN